MNKQTNTTNTDELDLKKLETRIDDLIKTCDGLKYENSTLKAERENLIKEQKTLTKNTEDARARIESMIKRLKGLESEL